MSASSKPITIILMLVLLFSGCAHQSLQSDSNSTETSTILKFDRDDCHHLHEQSVTSRHCAKREPQTPMKDIMYDRQKRVSGTDIFTYMIFRFVVEGLVYSLMNH